MDTSFDIPFLTPLPEHTLRTLGVPAPFTFGMRDCVRFGELDVLGHVNNAAYLKWFETLRIHYFRAYGVADYQNTIPRIVIRSAGIEFLSEVLANDNYTVAARTDGFRTTSFSMQYLVVVNGKITTKGTAVVVNLDTSGQKSPLRDSWKKTFGDRDGARGPETQNGKI